MTDYDLLAEFGRVDGQTVYLARERATGALAVARRPSGASASAPLTVSRVLDGTVPADGAVCPSCVGSLRTWGRFCPSCGREVFGTAPTTGEAPGAAELLQAVRDAAADRFDVLGALPRSDGGDTIYFAVDLNTADVVALRLAREGVEADGTLSYSLELPLTLSPVGPTVAPPAPAQAAPPKPPAPPAAPPPAPPAVNDDSFTSIFAVDSPRSAPPPRSPSPPPPPVPSAASATGMMFAPAAAPPAPPPPKAPEPVTVPSPDVPPAAKPRSPVPRAVIIGGGLVIGVIAAVLVVMALEPKRAPLVAVADTTTPPPVVRDTTTPKPAPVVDTTPRPPVATPAPEPKRPEPPKPKRRVASADTAGLGDAIAVCSSASLHSQWQTARPACERAAAAGNADAELSLGMMLSQSGTGAPRNMPEAVTWFRKSAEQGNARARNYLGWAYANGDGVARDGAQALLLFRQSAEAGNAQGEYGLGMMYANGTGTMRSDSLAVQWFRRAATNGDALARGELTRRGLTP